MLTRQLSQLNASVLLRSSVRRSMATSDGYLHKTKIPTYHFQPSLPRLPIPEVNDTCERFLFSAEPLVSEMEFQEAKDAVQDFLDNHAPALQETLVAKDKIDKSNYVSGPWYEMYLQDRRPLIVNSNPAVGWKNDPNRTTQLTRASSLLRAAAVTFRTLRDEQLEPDIFHTEPKKSQTGWWENVIPWVPSRISFFGAYAVGAYPLDMSQYDYLFQSTRLPGVGEDTLKKFTGSRHVCVMRGSKFYEVDILNENGDLLDEKDIYNSLHLILQEDVDVKTPPVGTLTSLDRDTWAHAREHMLQLDSTNANTFSSIDSSLFVLCLEHETTKTHEERFCSNVHGRGRNRWFDKSFSLIVDPDGGAAVNFEHAWGDGVAVIRFFNEVYKESMSSAVLENEKVQENNISTQTKTIDFVLDDQTIGTIREAELKVDKLLNSLDTKVLLSDVVDSKWIKAHKIGPDGFLQMAFQLAHATVHDGKAGATYESASTSAFKHGRTETIRSTTTLSQTMCDVFLSAESSNQEKATALRAAAENHGKLTRDALMGKGWDRHLFALKNIARDQTDLPKLFKCSAFETLNTIIMSTSTLASDALEGGGFGPVNPNCYAIPYGITKENVRFGVMSYDLDSTTFCNAIENSVKSFKDVLEKEEEENK
jgi:carnitine O-palmitoyltransferase 2